MKILIISAAFPPTQSGEATNAFYLSRHLVDRGFEVHVLTSKNNIALNNTGVKVHPIMRKWSWLEVPRFIKFAKDCSPDAILLMYIGWIYKSHPMITLAPTLLKRLLPQALFVTRFEYVQGPAPSLLFRVLRRGVGYLAGAKRRTYEFGTLLHHSDRIIILSDAHKAMLAEHLQTLSTKSVLIPPPPNVCVVPDPEGLVRQRGRKLLNADDQHFIVAYIGYIYPSKGLETLLEAFRIACEQGDHLRLVLIGGSIASEFRSGHRDCYIEELTALAKELGINHKIIWTGEFKWDSEEVSSYLRAADVCVLPFDDGVHLNNSSFSSVVSYGLPIITTKGELLEAPFLHEKNVLLCPPKTPEAIAEAIMSLKDSPELRQTLSMGSLGLAREWFSWERAIGRTLDVLGLGDEKATRNQSEFPKIG